MKEQEMKTILSLHGDMYYNDRGATINFSQARPKILKGHLKKNYLLLIIYSH